MNKLKNKQQLIYRWRKFINDIGKDTLFNLPENKLLPGRYIYSRLKLKQQWKETETIS